MLFNSYIFILLFLPLCILGYFGLNWIKKTEFAQAFLLGMSLWFYGFYNPWYVLIIIASVLLNYLVYRFIQKYRSKAKLFMVLGVAVNVGILGYFKYMDFFIENVNAVFKSNISLLGIALPLGISFFTFQQISFVVDAYKGEVPDYGFLDYACFVTFFPQLIAGPIVTHDELVPQFMDSSKKKIDWDNFGKGLFIFTLGLAKKVLLADTLGIAVEYGYAIPGSINSTEAIIVMLSYTLQIYFDFSGYCDMALGIGKMLNIDLPVNFNSPYKAVTITEFWDRWHMTLTRFLTKYIYIPLGGNRKGKVRTCINVGLVFLISGLWHGADWTFVFWGAIHGLFMIIARITKKVYEKIPKIINWFITFLFVNVAWVFFRADSFDEAKLLFSSMFAGNFGRVNPNFLESFRRIEFKKILSMVNLEDRFPEITMWGMLAVALIIALLGKNSKNMMDKFKPSALNWILVVFLFVWSVFSLTGMSTFLYFNF